ncbi:dynein regulatory complex subunit 2-like [Tachysurus fulvidraco]|uniref:dynein regulatory complex subunit 2-like n=1 Tax=Tachysurus fulvidraco TaxID=1234273 RepID=UPI001FEDE757|nr:dynein regulatory complex subunit 2-like [Tachysurus fulvidraco]
MNFDINLHKLNHQWRLNLRKARAEELHDDFAKLSQTFETLVACKDKVIKLLLSDLSEAEQQSALAHRAHLQCLDHFLEIQKSRLAALESHWNTSVKELSTDYSTEREKLLKLHQKESEYLNAENQALKQRYDEIYSEAKQDYEYTRDYNKIQYAGMKHAVESKVTEQQQRLLEEQEKYTNDNDKENNEVFDLQEAIQKIDMNGKHIHKLQNTISALRSHLSSSQWKNEASISGHHEDYEPLKQEIRHLRAKLSSSQAAEKTQLANHTIYSNDTINKLQGIIQESETLLHLAVVCRKLEMEQEKVLPFYTLSLNAEELSQEKAHAVETMMDYTDLEKFWKRYNKIVLERLCLERKKNEVGLENQHLRSLLKQYLDGVSVSDEILEQENSLLMLSRLSPQASPASKTQRRKHKPVIEAAHAVKYTL